MKRYKELGFSLLELLLVLALLGLLTLVGAWKIDTLYKYNQQQMVIQAVERMNDLVESYGLYYVEESGELVPQWPNKEAVLQSLQNGLPKTHRILLKNKELKKYVKNMNWSVPDQRFYSNER